MPPVSPAAGGQKTAESTTAKQDEVHPQSEQGKGPKDGLAIDVTVVGIDGKPDDQCQAITVWEKTKAATEIRSGDYTSTDPRDDSIWRYACGGHLGSASNHYFTGNTRPLPPGVYRVTAFLGARGEKMLGMAISDPIRLDGSQGTTSVTVPVQDGPPVAFSIADADTGEPVHYPSPGIRLTRPDGFDVQLDLLNPGLFPGSDGKYRIEHLAPGRYHVDVSARTYAYGYPDYQLGKPIDVDVQAGKPNDFTLKVAAKPVDDAEARKRWPWAVEGVVTDDAGRPLQGVEIRAATGVGTLRTTMPVISDSQGHYLLRFGPGMMMKNDKTGKWGAGVQAAIISARKAGYAEKDLERQGNLSMADNMPEEKLKWGRGVVLPGKPYRVDFVMVPATVVEGRIVDEKGDLVPNAGIYLDGDVLRPATSIGVSAKADGDGRFRFDAVPPGFAWWFQGGTREGIALSRTQPVTFAQGQSYKVELQVISQGDAGKMLRIASVKDSQGNELREKVVGDDPRARPLVDAQTAAKAREILDRVAEVNRYWLAAPSKDITAFSYTFHLKGQDPREITYQDYLNGTSWYPEWYGKGISYTGAARVLTSLRNKAKFRELKIGDKQISIYFVLKGLPSTVAAGNGIAGTWHGFAQGTMNEGRIVLDAKRLTPISIECGRDKERYDDYVETAPSSYVPLSIDI
ncbi:MAG: carboxypeptidase-like regulatory domain-containing protein, partial [Thermoguttaceae bacterium]